jgi:hypothetical protein
MIWRDGAEDRTRTGTGYPTRPSNVRVYQFRHFGAKSILAGPLLPLSGECLGSASRDSAA